MKPCSTNGRDIKNHLKPGAPLLVSAYGDRDSAELQDRMLPLEKVGGEKKWKLQK
ncbi:MAG: hypothetical protein ACQEWV_26785 [Bacillota bacterium]